MEMYEHKKIEKKWQENWRGLDIFKIADKVSGKENLYTLVEFPYPSGNLHIGHWYAFAVPDIYARAKRMQGNNVLYPIGFDAFGLPAENAALKRNINPRDWTLQNIEHMRVQLRSMGASFDWAREVVTCDSEYYKWTQWLFLQFFKNGLAYQAQTRVNWCPSCKTVLANEQVAAGRCERCDSEVEQKEMKQWQLRITDYAERLLDDLEQLDWPEEIKSAQRNWIGRSEGARVRFKILNSKFETNSKSKVQNAELLIEVFTTRPDTLFGATYMVLAPEHPLLAQLQSRIKNWPEAEKYIKQAQKKTELERLEEAKEKSGVELQGIKAINPVNQEEMPIFIADYVLLGYGTGAIMAVPGHDERDFEFARKFGLPVRQVVAPHVVDMINPPQPGKKNTQRIVIHGIVKHPKEDKVISLEWKQQPWRTFITGGAEAGEDVVDAARREVLEETGYKSLEYIGRLPYQIYSEFYAAHKDVNRAVMANFIMFKLKDLERDEIAPEEQALHEVKWIDLKDVAKLSPVSELEHVIKWLRHGDAPYTGEGVALNSGEFDGLSTAEFKKKIIQWLEKNKLGQRAVNYRLRDWLVSRQRYWGCPIPVSHCPQCGPVAVPDKDLPVVLPAIDDYKPRNDGKSPLAKQAAWLQVKCPQCGQSAERESDTLDTFVDSAWYFLRYADPKNAEEFAAQKQFKQWLPVDYYSGGAEHTTMHLLYSRFWIKAMQDLKLVDFAEPYLLRKNRGLIMGPDGQKMSKSKGNVVDPDEYVEKLGADTVRMYLAFIGPYNEVGAYPWDLQGIIGVRKFLERIWRLQEKIVPDAKDETAILKLLHQTIKKVTADIDKLKFNTAISQLMILANFLEKQPQVSAATYKLLLLLLAPFSPHIADELWERQGGRSPLVLEAWPAHDEALAREDEIELVVQINGRVRDRVRAAVDITQADAEKLALALEKIKAQLGDNRPKKIVYVPGRLINIVL